MDAVDQEEGLGFFLQKRRPAGAFSRHIAGVVINRLLLCLVKYFMTVNDILV